MFIKCRKNHKRSSHLNHHSEFKKREARIILNFLNSEMFLRNDLFKRDNLLCPLLETTTLLLNVNKEFSCFLFQNPFTLLFFPPFLYQNLPLQETLTSRFKSRKVPSNVKQELPRSFINWCIIPFNQEFLSCTSLAFHHLPLQNRLMFLHQQTRQANRKLS